LPLKQKQEAVAHFEAGLEAGRGVTRTARELKIPARNLRRWQKGERRSEALLSKHADSLEDSLGDRLGQYALETAVAVGAGVVTGQIIRRRKRRGLFFLGAVIIVGALDAIFNPNPKSSRLIQAGVKGSVGAGADRLFENSLNSGNKRIDSEKRKVYR